MRAVAREQHAGHSHEHEGDFNGVFHIPHRADRSFVASEVEDAMLAGMIEWPKQ